MRPLAIVALVVAMYVLPASACSIDMLKKISEDHLDRLPSGLEHEFTDSGNSQQGGTWQMFEGENALPHSLLVAWLDDGGQTKLRISFLTLRDFVIAETRIDYTERVFAKDFTGKFKTEPPQRYFFCDGKLQGSVDAKTVETANRWKKWFFESDMLKPELQRVPK